MKLTESILQCLKEQEAPLYPKKIDGFTVASDEDAFINSVLEKIDSSYISRCVNGDSSYDDFKKYWEDIIIKMNEYLNSDKLKRFDKSKKEA